MTTTRADARRAVAFAVAGLAVVAGMAVWCAAAAAAPHRRPPEEAFLSGAGGMRQEMRETGGDRWRLLDAVRRCLLGDGDACLKINRQYYRDHDPADLELCLNLAAGAADRSLCGVAAVTGTLPAAAAAIRSTDADGQSIVARGTHEWLTP